jgi:hypothetical protein
MEACACGCRRARERMMDETLARQITSLAAAFHPDNDDAMIWAIEHCEHKVTWNVSMADFRELEDEIYTILNANNLPHPLENIPSHAYTWVVESYFHRNAEEWCEDNRIEYYNVGNAGWNDAHTHFQIAVRFAFIQDAILFKLRFC